MTEKQRFFSSGIRKALCFALSLVLAIGLFPAFPSEAYAASGKELQYSASLISQVGNQARSGHNWCCSNYACAYGDTMFTGKVQSHEKYDSRKPCGKNKAYCGWTNWSNRKYSSSLKMVIDQIDAGKPVLLHVKNKPGWGDQSPDQQHWVTVIGYKNVSNASSAGLGNLIALDPCDGKKITVSDRYKRHSDNRLQLSSTGWVVPSKPNPVTVYDPVVSTQDVIGGKRVSIDSQTKDAVIHYTVDGKTDPSANRGDLYKGTFMDTWPVMGVRAIATKGGTSSRITYKTLYNKAVVNPVITVSGNESSPSITMSTTTSGATIYYTLDGTAPTTSSKRYSGPIALNDSANIKCIAVKAGMLNSSITSKYVLVQPPKAPVASVAENKIAVGDPVQLTWKAESNATEYIATLYRDGEVVDSTTTKGTAASFTLSEAGKYEVSVKGKNSVGEGDSCDPIPVEAMNPCTVRFVDKTVGENGEETYVLLDEQQVKYGTAAMKPATPKKTGYTFSGWNESFNEVVSDMQIVAEWDINTYVVQFYAEDGTTRLSRQVVEYGNAADAPDPGEGRPGYTFTGWSVMAADDGSMRDYQNVDSDMKLRAVYSWDYDNASYIKTEITSATRTADGIYTVDVKMNNNPDKPCTSILRVALKTSDGKMVQSSRQTVALLADSEHIESVTLKYSGDYVATVAEVELLGIDGNYRTGGGYSKAVTSPIVSTDDFSYSNWSEWSTEKPELVGEDVVEQAAQFRYRDKVSTTSTESALDGWTRDGSVSYSYGPWSGNKTTTNTMSESDTVHVVGKSPSAYYYYHYCSYYTDSGGAGWKQDSKPVNNTSVKHTKSSTSLWPIISGFQDKGGNGATARRNTSARCEKGYSTYWLERTQYTYTYQTRTKTPVYGYWKWGDYSDWSTEEVAPTSNRQVDTQTVYRTRSKIPNLVSGNEDTSGTRFSVKGKLDLSSDFKGGTATVLVYNATNSDPNEDQIQYIGQIQIAADGSYDFSFIPKTDPSVETGDFTVALALDGASGLVNIDTIKAPRPQYKVTYQYADNNGAVHVVSEQTIQEGDNAQVPDAPKRDGYRFAGWSASATKINGDMVISALFVPETYSVAWVDWASGNIVMEEYEYGEELVPPTNEPKADGMDFKGWDALLDGKTTVSGDMVINAVFDVQHHKVTFLDKEGNAFDVQDVEHGKSAAVPAENPTYTGMVFLGWETSEQDPWWNVERDMSVKPIFVFPETVESPVASLDVEQNSGYTGADGVTVTLESATDGAELFYTTDGSEPTAESERYDADKGVVVKEPTLVKAVACKEGMNDSAVTEVPTNVTATNDLANAEMTAEAEGLFANEPVEASVGLSIGETVLEEGVDFEVNYEGNDQAGTATATAVGKGKYEGTQSCDFQIQAFSVDLYYGNDPSGYAANMYKYLLGQEVPDESNVRELANKLQSGVSAKDAVKQMVASADFANRDLNRRDTVSALCNVLMGAGCFTDDDVSTWAAQLLSGSTVGGIIDAIAETDAYVAQCNKYGVYADDHTQKPELIAKASTGSVKIGEKATFTCKVEGADGADLAYKWQQSANGGSTWRDCATSGSASKTMSYAFTEARKDYQFRCVVTASDGRSATTEAIGFEMSEPEVALTATASVEPVKIGERAKFTCKVEGAGDADLTYKWQQSANGGSSWRNCVAMGSGSEEMSYVYSEARKDYKFRCVVTASDGRSATTEAIGFEMSEPEVALTATASVEPVKIGEKATFTCKVEGADGADLAYKWQQSASGGSTWRDCATSGSASKTMSYAFTEARKDYQFRCVVTASDGRSATTEAIGFEEAIALEAASETESDAMEETDAGSEPEATEEPAEGAADAEASEPESTEGDIPAPSEGESAPEATEGEFPADEGDAQDQASEPIVEEPVVQEESATVEGETCQESEPVFEENPAEEAAPAITAEGICGGCSWQLASDGTLTITATSDGVLNASDWGWSEGGLYEGAWRSGDIRHLVTNVVFVGYVSSGAHLDSMFAGCSNLMSVDLSGLDTSSCVSAEGMFAGTPLEGVYDIASFAQAV